MKRAATADEFYDSLDPRRDEAARRRRVPQDEDGKG
jgi:hypothetical protein